MKTFELRPEHIKLLQGMYFDYRDDYETGAPGADQKRPYGNSYVAGDVAEILGIEIPDDDGDGRSERDDIEEEMLELHRETGTALQVILSAQSFEPGKYRNTASGQYAKPRWRKV